MATSPYGGYTPPSYGGYNGGYNYAPQMNMQSPYAQQLARYEQMNPQYGQTMPPMQNMPQNYQQGQGMQPGQGQPMQNQPNEALIAVATLDDARNYLPDMSGNRQIFSITNEPNRLVAKRFNIGDASTDFVVFAPMEDAQRQPQSVPEQAETATQTAEQPDMMQEFKSQFEAMQEQHKRLQEAVMEMKEDFNAKLSSLSANDDAAKPADGASSAANTGMGADGGESSGDHKQSTATESRKPNARTAKGEKPGGD